MGTERPAVEPVGPDRLVEPDRADAGDGRHAVDRDAALTPIFTALRRGRGGGPAPGFGLRLAPEPVERHGRPADVPDPGRPGPARARPYPTGGYHAASVDLWVGRVSRGVDPHASGGFRGAEPQASGRFREVEPYASSGFRWPVVAPSASGGHRAVSADLHTWGVEPRAHAAASGASGELHRTHGNGASVDPFDPGSFAPRAAPPSRTETTAVWSPGDYSMPPQQVTDTGRHHRRLAPPAGDRESPVCRREWARSPARVATFAVASGTFAGASRRFVGLSRHVCRRTARLIAICARGAVGAEALRVSDRGCPLLGR
jgi:hypothetical protein